jgi:hypothetical protein
MSSYGKRVLIMLCLGAMFPSIVVLVCWMATFGQMFNLLEGIVPNNSGYDSVVYMCKSCMSVRVTT